MQIPVCVCAHTHLCTASGGVEPRGRHPLLRLVLGDQGTHSEKPFPTECRHSGGGWKGWESRPTTLGSVPWKLRLRAGRWVGQALSGHAWAPLSRPGQCPGLLSVVVSLPLAWQCWAGTPLRPPGGADSSEVGLDAPTGRVGKAAPIQGWKLPVPPTRGRSDKAPA